MNATNLIALNDLTNLLPRRSGKKVHVKTVTRWVTKGCRGIRLEAVKIGSVWFSSESWLLDFQRQCSERTSQVKTPSVAGGAIHQMASRILKERYGFHDSTEESEVPHLPKDSGKKRTL